MSDANKYGRSIQCWPSGRMLEVIGDPPTEIRERTADGWGEWRTPTPAELWTVKVQDTAARLLAQDVYHVDSCLVDELLRHGDSVGRERVHVMGEELPGDLAQEWSWENVRGLTVDPDDWDLEQCREYLDDHGAGYPDPDPWGMDREDLVRAVYGDAVWDELEANDGHDPDDGPAPTLSEEAAKAAAESENDLRVTLSAMIDRETVDGIDDWRDAVREHSQDNPPDVYEWYRVSPWLLGKLHEIGEVTIDNAYGEWWGRTCTGQGVIMDGTFQKIAELLHAGEKPKDDTAG